MSRRPRENKPSGRQGSSFSGVFAAAFEEAAKRDQGLNVEQYKELIAPEETSSPHESPERKPEQSQESGASSTPKSKAPQRSAKPVPLTAKASQARKKTPTRQVSGAKKPAAKPNPDPSSPTKKTRQKATSTSSKKAQKPNAATPSRKPAKKTSTYWQMTRSKISPVRKLYKRGPASTATDPESPLESMKKSGFKARKPFSVSAFNEYEHVLDEDHHPKWQPPAIKDRHGHKGTSSARHSGSSGPSGMPIDFRDDTFIRWDDD